MVEQQFEEAMILVPNAPTHTISGEDMEGDDDGRETGARVLYTQAEWEAHFEQLKSRAAGHGSSRGSADDAESSECMEEYREAMG